MLRLIRSFSSTNWSDVTFDSCDKFTFAKEGERGKVVKVVDGDTVHVAFSRDGRFVRMPCRLPRIDTPEIHSRDEAEKTLAQRARDVLKDACLNKMVSVSHVEQDKYGRLLAEVTADGTNLSDFMLAHADVCRGYDGGAKTSWSKHG